MAVMAQEEGCNTFFEKSEWEAQMILRKKSCKKSILKTLTVTWQIHICGSDCPGKNILQKA